MTTKPLCAERRKRVAETVEGCAYEWRNPWTSGGHEVLFQVGGSWSWNPREDVFQKDGLTQTTARLIREEISRSSGDRLQVYMNKLVRFNAALATDDVPAIEQLCAEMLEAKDG